MGKFRSAVGLSLFLPMLAAIPPRRRTPAPIPRSISPTAARYRPHRTTRSNRAPGGARATAESRSMSRKATSASSSPMERRRRTSLRQRRRCHRSIISGDDRVAARAGRKSLRHHPPLLHLERRGRARGSGAGDHQTRRAGADLPHRLHRRPRQSRCQCDRPRGGGRCSGIRLWPGDGPPVRADRRRSARAILSGPSRLRRRGPRRRRSW